MKRGSLAGLYKATEIYMLQDRSEDNIDTWAFLDRRLDSLQTFGKIVRNVSAVKTCDKNGIGCILRVIIAVITVVISIMLYLTDKGEHKNVCFNPFTAMTSLGNGQRKC